VARERRELDSLPVRSDALNLDGKALGELPLPELNGLGQMRHALGDGRDADDAAAITPWIPEAPARCVKEQRRAHLRNRCPTGGGYSERAGRQEPSQRLSVRDQQQRGAHEPSVPTRRAPHDRDGKSNYYLRSAEQERDRPRVGRKACVATPPPLHPTPLERVR
jgi:hypothetical protein